MRDSLLMDVTTLSMLYHNKHCYSWHYVALKSFQENGILFSNSVIPVPHPYLILVHLTNEPIVRTGLKEFCHLPEYSIFFYSFLILLSLFDGICHIIASVFCFYFLLFLVFPVTTFET